MAWIASLTSQMLTFIPASTRPSRSQNAMNSRLPRRRGTPPGRSRPARRSRRTPCPGRTGRCRSTAPGRRRRPGPSMDRGGRLRLVQRVGPVLDPDVPAEQRMVGVRHVPRPRRCRGRRCAATRRPRTPSPHLQARRLGQLGVGRAPTPTIDRVGRRCDCRRPAARRRLPAAAGDLGYLDAEAQVDAVLAVQGGEDPAHLRAEYVQQRQLGRLQDRHLDPGRPSRRGDLQADPARADHRIRVAACEGRPDPVAVGHPAQVAARRRRRRPAAAGAAAPTRWPAAVCRSRSGCRRPAPPRGRSGRSPVTGVPSRSSTPWSAYQPRVDVDRLAFGLALQVVLGQRRPLVRPDVFLVAAQHDPAAEPLLAQRLRRPWRRPGRRRR